MLFSVPIEDWMLFNVKIMGAFLINNRIRIASIQTASKQTGLEQRNHTKKLFESGTFRGWAIVGLDWLGEDERFPHAHGAASQLE